MALCSPTAAWPVGKTLNPNLSFDVGIRNEEAACLWHSQKNNALKNSNGKTLLPKILFGLIYAIYFPGRV